MRIINQTKNTLLAKEAVIAERLIKRTKGLLDRTSFKFGEGIVIRPCKSVHTWFMAFPIDVVFVGKDSRVLRTIPNLRPFRITPLFFKAGYVIELPIGTIQRTETCESDLILLE